MYILSYINVCMYTCIHACMMNNQEVRNQRADRTTLSWLQEGDNALSHTEEDSEDSPDGEYVCTYIYSMHVL